MSSSSSIAVASAVSTIDSPATSVTVCQCMGTAEGRSIGVKFTRAAARVLLVHHARRRSAVHHQGLRQWCSRQHTLLQQARRSAVHHRRLRQGFSGPHRLLHQGVGTVHPGAFEAGCPRAAFADHLQCQRCMPRCIAENSCSSGAAERYGFALRQGRSDRRLPPLQQPHSSELGQFRAADAQSLGRTWCPSLVALEWPRRRPGRALRARRPAMQRPARQSSH